MSLLPIPELIKLLTHLFFKGELGEVQKILMEREKKIKIQIEGLERDRDALKRMQGFAGFEEKLKESQKECEELRKKITRLNADKLSNHRDIKKEEEHVKMVDEKNKTISELKNQILKRDQLLGDCREKFKSLEMRTAQMETGVEKLKQQKSEADQIIDKLRCQLSESELREEKLRERNREACQTLEQLRHQVLAAEVHKMRSGENMKKMRQKQSEAHQAVEELRGQILAAEMHKKMSDQAMKELKYKQSEATKTVEELRRQNLKAFRTVEELRHQNLEAYKAAEMHKKRFDKLVPMAEELANLLKEKADDLACLVNLKDKFVAVEGCKQSFETNPDGAAHLADLCTNLGENEMISENFCSSPSSDRDCTDISFIIQKRKRSKLGSEDDSLTIDGHKEKQNIRSIHNSHGYVGLQQHLLLSRSNSELRRCQEKMGPESDKFGGFDGRSSTNNFHSKKHSKAWMFGADMLKAFLEDDELCMNAVCVLYRQQISASNSSRDSNGVFSHFEAMSGRALAEYLIDGNPELRLMKSVSEVKEQFPNIINQCRRLATDYYEQLFILYCNRGDPFF